MYKKENHSNFTDAQCYNLLFLTVEWRFLVSLCQEKRKKEKKKEKRGGGFLKISYMNDETPVSPWQSMTVTKAKIRQAYICSLLLTLTSYVRHFFSLSLSQIIELEEGEPKLFTKTIEPKKKKKNCSQRLIKINIWKQIF